VLLDDVGFGASSAFGGPCHTPNAEKLAAGGLKFNRFHTTALCSPTRACVLTGRNHHRVGMGRIIGDNGTVFTVVDIAVAPALQGRGLGKRILAALDAWLQANVPESAYVTLVADGDAKYLYAKFGFAESAPYAVNMEYVMGVNGRRITGIP